MNLLILVFAAVLAAPVAFGQAIFDGQSGNIVELGMTMPGVKAGDVIVIGENHGFKTHQLQQLQIMRELRARGLKMSVALEFLNYTDQLLINQWRQGDLTEADFLSKIGWGSPLFDYYRDQALFPEFASGELTLGINAPRSLTSKVAKQGISSLNPAELALLPPNFELGRDSYKKRFLGMMPHLPSPEAGERYFAAQSIWDDTMAWSSSVFLKENPGMVLVIIVGDFHAQFGGGLPDRLKARGVQGRIWIWSQLNSDGLSESEIIESRTPSAEYGLRGHYIWVEEAKP